MDTTILQGLEQVWALINWLYLVIVVASSFGLFRVLDYFKVGKNFSKDKKRAFKTLVVALVGITWAIIAYYLQFYGDVAVSADAVTKKTFVESYVITFLLEVFLYDVFIKMAMRFLASKIKGTSPTPAEIAPEESLSSPLVDQPNQESSL